jgi:isopentenyl-diphosphate delta-isomerase
MSTERVILVDHNDRPIGTEEKLTVHKEGLLHRAFSAFIFNDHGELLLQKRARDKYHSAGLWSNTCCSHPRPGEPVLAAATRRLEEEMGIRTVLTPAFAFHYRTEFDDSLVENEFDHVLIGRYRGDPNPNPSEVAAWMWMDPARVAGDIAVRPDRYTVWFRLVLARVRQFIRDGLPA